MCELSVYTSKCVYVGNVQIKTRRTQDGNKNDRKTY